MRKALSATTTILCYFAMAGADATAQINSVPLEGCLVGGTGSGKVTVEEFLNFESRECARVSNTINELMPQYQGRVNFVFRNLVSPTNAKGYVAAKALAATCIQNPILAQELQTKLFINQDEFLRKGEAYVYQIAKEIGVDLERLKSDMNSDVVAKQLLKDQEMADLYGFKETPSMMVGKKAIVGTPSYPGLKSVIEQELRDN